MFRVRRVIGPVGTLYIVIHAYTYNFYGKFDNVMDAYRRAKELNENYLPRV